MIHSSALCKSTERGYVSDTSLTTLVRDVQFGRQCDASNKFGQGIAQSIARSRLFRAALRCEHA